FFFFFQAEDGIRDFHVTGVQTCALPISRRAGRDRGSRDRSGLHADYVSGCAVSPGPEAALGLAHRHRARGWNDLCEHRDQRALRSEERRVGKEVRLMWLEYAMTD